MVKVEEKSEDCEFRLFDYLNGACRTLCFACSANEAFVYFGWDGFAVFHFVNAYWACVYAGFASSTFVVINLYFYHISYLLWILLKSKARWIKVFRCVSVFLHVFLREFRLLRFQLSLFAAGNLEAASCVPPARFRLFCSVRPRC